MKRSFQLKSIFMKDDLLCSMVVETIIELNFVTVLFIYLFILKKNIIH